VTLRLRVSVIIATYNRAALLDECLDHLLRQRFSPGDEIVVVDNGSTDNTDAVVARHQRRCPVPLRLVHESVPGKSRAISRAVVVATGNILAFTDDDVNVGDGWLEAVREAMTDPVVALAGGPVEPRWQPGVPEWIRRGRERYPRLGAPIALLDYGERTLDLGPRTVLGANLAVRKDVFVKVGGFPATLGKLRGTLLSGEDHELCRRVQDAGFVARYVPQVSVKHWVPADRARVSYFLRWFYWSGITHAMMDTRESKLPSQEPARGGPFDPSTGSGSPRAESRGDRLRAARTLGGLPLYLVARAAKASARALAALAAGNRASALSMAIDVAFTVGYAAERWGLAGHAPQAPARVAGEAA
jgi:glycosyltransferase involved in cell wall biosynthesis